MKLYSIPNNKVYLPLANHDTNIGYRIANFLHIMRGSNDLSFLSRYSKHINESSDDNKSLRGAFGPRMRNWIGAHQLQDMINLNSNVDQAENYIKPVGIDQSMSVFDDLNSGMTSSTVTIRDPGIDFDISQDIPDLTALTFSLHPIANSHECKIVCDAFYQGVGANLLNEVWSISLLTQLYQFMLDNVASSEVNIAVCYGDPVLQLNQIQSKVGENMIFSPDTIASVEDRESFWIDLDCLQNLATHIQFYLNESTFNNPMVSTETCRAALDKVFSSKIKNRVLKDMAYALAIWAFDEYGMSKDSPNTAQYEEQILSLMENMSKYIQLSGGYDTHISAELKRHIDRDGVMQAIRQKCEITA